jgi:hypothetical protein
MFESFSSKNTAFGPLITRKAVWFFFLTGRLVNRLPNMPVMKLQDIQLSLTVASPRRASHSSLSQKSISQQPLPEEHLTTASPRRASHSSLSQKSIPEQSLLEEHLTVTSPKRASLEEPSLQALRIEHPQPLLIDQTSASSHRAALASFCRATSTSSYRENFSFFPQNSISLFL